MEVEGIDTGAPLLLLLLLLVLRRRLALGSSPYFAACFGVLCRYALCLAVILHFLGCLVIVESRVLLGSLHAGESTHTSHVKGGRGRGR